MDTFRILHVSDLHIAERLSPSKGFLNRYLPKIERYFWPASIPRLKALMRAAGAHAPDCDSILITGDLANSGDRGDLEAARLFIDKRLTPKRAKDHGLGPLDAIGKPIYLFPGNHDRYSDSPGAGGEKFDDVFEPYWRVGKGAASFVLGGKLGVVMGDLTLGRAEEAKGIGGEWGQGRAAKERVAFMVTETERLRSKYTEIVVIWAVHFPPEFSFSSEFKARTLKLLEEERLINAAEDQEIPLLLCGHTHEHRGPYKVGTRGIVEVLCVGSACQQDRGEKNTIYLVELDVDRGALVKPPRVTTLTFVPREGQFKP